MLETVKIFDIVGPKWIKVAWMIWQLLFHFEFGGICEKSKVRTSTEERNEVGQLLDGKFGEHGRRKAVVNDTIDKMVRAWWMGTMYSIFIDFSSGLLVYRCLFIAISIELQLNLSKKSERVQKIKCYQRHILIGISVNSISSVVTFGGLLYRTLNITLCWISQ